MAGRRVSNCRASLRLGPISAAGDGAQPLWPRAAATGLGTSVPPPVFSPAPSLPTPQHQAELRQVHQNLPGMGSGEVGLGMMTRRASPLGAWGGSLAVRSLQAGPRPVIWIPAHSPQGLLHAGVSAGTRGQSWWRRWAPREGRSKPSESEVLSLVRWSGPIGAELGGAAALPAEHTQTG